VIYTNRPSSVSLWHLRQWEPTRSRHGWRHIVNHALPPTKLNLQLHTVDLVKTCRISSFCTVAWQLARFQLRRRIARSLGDSWASCFYYSLPFKVIAQPPPPYDSTSALHSRTTFLKPATTLDFLSTTNSEAIADSRFRPRSYSDPRESGLDLRIDERHLDPVETQQSLALTTKRRDLLSTTPDRQPRAR